MNLVEIVTRKIKLLRESNNFSQQYVAGELDISQNAYSLLEKGSTKITLDRLEQVANLYKISVAQLVSDTEVAHPADKQTWAHSNLPPSFSPLEKIMYEDTIHNLEGHVSKLYQMIEQLSTSFHDTTADKSKMMTNI